jgi:hypothetical protein
VATDLAQHWEALRANLPALLYVAWFTFAVAGAVLLLVVYRRWPNLFHPLLPPQRWRYVSWDGLDIIFILVLVYILVPGVALGFLEESGFYRWYYGISALEPKSPLEHMGLWAQALALPLQIVLLFSLLRARRGTEPYQVGITVRRWPQNVIVGFLGWLVITPITFAILIGVQELH